MKRKASLAKLYKIKMILLEMIGSNYKMKVDSK